MTSARDVMSEGAQCIGEDQTLVEAARMMRDMGVGSLPICGNDNRLKGMITDRDIVVRCIAEDGDCTTTKARDLAQGHVFFVEAGTDLDQALAIMREHQIKRLPVIDNHELVGMISETDLSRALDQSRLSDFVSEVYAPTS